MKILLGFLLMLCALPAFAHRNSDSFISLQTEAQGAQGKIDIALRDWHRVLALDSNDDGAITWAEVRQHELAIVQTLHRQLRLSRADKNCTMRWHDLHTTRRQDDYFVVLRFVADCVSNTGELRLHYDFLRDIDSSHRALLTMTDSSQLHVIVPGQALGIADTKRDSVFLAFVQEGMHHIWIGVDHLLFLLCLLLPAALQRRQGQWQARQSRKEVLIDMIKLVSSFTVAHSLTLIAASLHWFNLPMRWVESAIALSVLLAALNLLWPVVSERLWRVTFLFGLLHGFGFAAVLADLQLSTESRLTSLLAFNLGVEIGQLAVVAGVLPLLLYCRHVHWYRHRVLPLGASSIAAIAGVWLSERALELDLWSWL